MKQLRVFLLFSFLISSFAGAVQACESCLVTVLGRRDDVTNEPKSLKRVFIDFMFEQQDWDELDPMLAHELHHDGHHIHNKTHEEFTHVQAGVNPHEQVTILADMPYVVRGSIEIDEHDRVGERQTSEGWGDLNLVGIWRAIQNADGFLGVTGGVKFPTGGTDETKPDDSVFEIELQPGSGSYDFPVGGVFRYISGPVTFTGNAIYVIKTEGAREFEFGDTFTTSLVAEALLNPADKAFRTSLGLDLNFQHAEKQTEHGVEIVDSGGNVLFAGPSLTIRVNENSLVYGTFLFPVSQNMNGVHQEMDFTWTAGAKIQW